MEKEQMNMRLLEIAHEQENIDILLENAQRLKDFVYDVKETIEQNRNYSIEQTATIDSEKELDFCKKDFQTFLKLSVTNLLATIKFEAENTISTDWAIQKLRSQNIYLPEIKTFESFNEKDKQFFSELWQQIVDTVNYHNEKWLKFVGISINDPSIPEETRIKLKELYDRSMFCEIPQKMNLEGIENSTQIGDQYIADYIKLRDNGEKVASKIEKLINESTDEELKELVEYANYKIQIKDEINQTQKWIKSDYLEKSEQRIKNGETGIFSNEFGKPHKLHQLSEIEEQNESKTEEGIQTFENQKTIDILNAAKFCNFNGIPK